MELAMIGRLLKWNAERRAWNREHEQAWAAMNQPGESGLTRFQILCEAAVVSALAEARIALVGREMTGLRESYVKAQIAGTPWTLWVYADAADVTSPNATLVRMEAWDAKTPDDFITAFVNKMRSGLRSQREGSV